MSTNNKVMPNSLEAEQAVIASMLIDNAVNCKEIEKD